MQRFVDKVVVVTGAGGGIGEGYAKAFAAEGASIVIAELNAAAGERVAKEIEASGGNALAVACDVSDEEATKRLGAEAVSAFGGVDVLVNNAGLFKDMEQHSLEEIPISYWNKFFDISFTGALLCARAVAPSMRERGGGAIINQSSTAAYMAAGAYGLAKLAQNGLTYCLAKEFGPSNIRVNGIAPGPTDTEAMRQQSAEVITAVLAMSGLGKMATPQDMANVVLFLASDEAALVSGVITTVDGAAIFRP
jgi:NAD(P)-dependent dehydrogenase (short-subunit alcohol dehydrogenase family)